MSTFKQNASLFTVMLDEHHWSVMTVQLAMEEVPHSKSKVLLL